MFLHACVIHSVHGGLRPELLAEGSASDQTPHPDQTPPRPDTFPDQTPPPRDGYCIGRYASYWNAFFLALH